MSARDVFVGGCILVAEQRGGGHGRYFSLVGRHCCGYRKNRVHKKRTHFVQKKCFFTGGKVLKYFTVSL